MAERSDRAALRAELFSLIGEAAPDLDGTLGDDTPLITSGIMESITLLELARWVDERVSVPLDITAFDLVAEWDTPGSILDFVERHRDR